MKLDLTICTTDRLAIQQSFDQIAQKLMNSWILAVQDNQYRFSEIEFYYFHEKCHRDNYTHEHQYDEGRWRFHNAGLDITFDGKNGEFDGGILIRGIYNESVKEYVNGPRRVVRRIFDELQSVYSVHKKLGLIYDSDLAQVEIFKTTRQGLSVKVSPEFKDKEYRFYTRIDDWNSRHVSLSERSEIKSKSSQV